MEIEEALTILRQAQGERSEDTPPVRAKSVEGQKRSALSLSQEVPIAITSITHRLFYRYTENRSRGW